MRTTSGTIVFVGGARRGGLIGLWLLSACTFDTGSGNGPNQLEDTDGTTSSSTTTSDAPATNASGGGTGGTSDASQTGTGSGDTEEGSSGAADESTTSIDPSQGNPPRADLVFVQEGPVDFGVHPLSGPTVLTLQLTNQGEAPAAVQGGDDPPSPLQWAGGVFPGTDATCDGSLAPGATCTVALEVGPGQPGFASGALAVLFNDDVGSGTASVPVDLIATGQGPNLIENADAESDPEGTILTGWDAEDSSFRTTTAHNHGAGSLSFYGGGSENPEITQDVVLSSWSTSIDDLGLRFVMTGWTRANDDFWNDDPHGISITFLDGTGAGLDDHSRSGMTHDGWEPTNFDVAIPAGTRRVRIRLSCDRNDALIGNSNCSAWFDDFSGTLVYATPK